MREEESRRSPVSRSWAGCCWWWAIAASARSSRRCSPSAATRCSCCRRGEDVVEVVERDAVDVVLIDASPSLTAAAREAARLESLHPPVAIVAVSEGLQPGLAAMPVLPKWTDFEAVFAAIEPRAPGLQHGA